MSILLKEKYQAIDNLIADANAEVVSAIERLEEIREDSEVKRCLNSLAIGILKEFSKIQFNYNNDQETKLTRGIGLGSLFSWKEEKKISSWIAEGTISEKSLEDYINNYINPNKVSVEIGFSIFDRYAMRATLI